MKRYLLPVLLVMFFFLLYSEAGAQRSRYYRHYPVYRSRPMVTVGIGGMFGGYYGPRVWGYGWGPRVGVNVGVVIPPPGARINGLPPGTVKKEINGITYYYRSNTYYREREDGGFEVVEAPLGATVSRPPLGAKLQKVDGKYYYEKDGTYYYKDIDANGNTMYIIAGKNGELNTDAAFGKDDSDQPDNRSGNYNDAIYDEPIVKNGNAVEEGTAGNDKSGAYTVKPEAGDRFEQLPRNSRAVTVDGEKQYVSPNGIYYKEVTEDGNTLYEVVKNK